MELIIAHLVNLFLISIFVGTEFAIGVFIHPVLRKLPESVHIASVQAVGKKIGKVMPVWIPLILLSVLPILYFTGDAQALPFWLTIAGGVCIILMLLISLIINVPINKGILKWNSQSPPNNWLNLRNRWDKWHMFRLFLDLIALLLFLYAALL